MDKVSQINILRIIVTPGSNNGYKIMIAVYRSHTADSKNFVINEYLSSIVADEILFIGDCNINLMSTDPLIVEYINNFSELGFILDL